MTKYSLLVGLLILLFWGCNSPTNDIRQEPIRLTFTEANRLAALPLGCMQVEYPNKLTQTLNDNYEGIYWLGSFAIYGLQQAT